MQRNQRTSSPAPSSAAADPALGLSRAFSGVLICALIGGLAACNGGSVDVAGHGSGGGTLSELEEGRALFRGNALGMETFWSDVAGLDTGLVRAGFSTLDALSLGLQLDSEAMDPTTLTRLTDELAGGLSSGNLGALSDPLLFERLVGKGAVVGLVGVETDGAVGLALDGPDSLGISCALCHSAVDGSDYRGTELAGAIGRRVDGQAPSALRLGALFAYADRSSALYPYLPQSHATIGGFPIARTEAFVESTSTEAEFDSVLADPAVFPAGLWDATPDGIGNPTVLPHVFAIRAGAPYGIAGEFRNLMDSVNAHATLGLDPTTLLTPSGRPFMNRIANGIGTEIVNEYGDIFAATGAMVPVGGLPYIAATATGIISNELSPIGYRLDERELWLLSLYLQSLRAPRQSVGDPAARVRGEATYALACASCHGPLNSPVANELVSLLHLVYPYAPSTLLARGFPYSDVLDDRHRTYDDRLVIFDRLYAPAQVPAQARDYSAPVLRGLELQDVYLHDGSVASLDALLDPARGAGQPHAFFVESPMRADLIEFLVTR